VIVFGVDDNAKTYLERQVGLKEANRLMSSEVQVWSWNVRFFKPQQEEEYRVGVSPEGNITGYEHVVPEALAGRDPSRETAQKTAQNFLEAKLGKAASDWDFLPEESNSVKRPNRRDWTFTWEKHGFRAKDAPERLKIELNGDQIGGAREALKVPEQWVRDYKHLRSTNEFYNTVAIIPYLLLFGMALGIGIQLTRKGQTNWKLALQLGTLVAILLTAMQLNRWPLDLSGFDTNSAYGSFVIKRVMVALAFGLFSALTVSLVLPGGEPLYRAAKPEFLRLRNAFTWRGVRSKEFFSSTIVGFSLAAAHMGFLVAFYLIANHFGAWSPQEVKYDDTLNTSIPWIGGDQRRVLVPAVRNSLPDESDQISDCGGNFAGVCMGISTHGVSERAALHSRAGSWIDRCGGRNGDATVGNCGDAGVALHGGRVHRRAVPDSVEQFVLANFWSGDRAGSADSLRRVRVLADTARKF
jgi:hypothetical protein